LGIKNDVEYRQNSIHEHLSTMQMLCIFILMLGFIEYKQASIYPLNNLYLFAFLSFRARNRFSYNNFVFS
jgi:hypothetical protein